MFDQARHKLLGGWAHFVSRRPRLVLAVAMAGVFASVVYAAMNLGFRGDRNELISEKLDWNQRFIAWRDAFPGTSDLYVLIDTQGVDGVRDEASIARARALADELGHALRADPLVDEAVWRYRTDVESLHPRAVRVLPMKSFDAELSRIAAAAPLLESPTPARLLEQAGAQGAQDDPLAGRSPGEVAAGLETLAALLDGFTQRMQTPADRPVDLAGYADVQTASPQWQYLATENQRLLSIRISPAREADALNPYLRSIRQTRQALDTFREKHPDVAFGLTGIEVVETDETDATLRDSTLASILATVLIAVLLVSAFHSVRAPLLLMISLGVAIAWSFGFLTLTIGYLQVISVVFTVILLGLGVAFGIHIVSCYELIRHNYPDDKEGFARALADTLEVMGPGLLTGAITTSVAFCATLLTDFNGVAEMGLIAAAGVMLCLLSMVSVFPALICLFKCDHGHIVRMEDRSIHFFEESWVMPFVRRPVWTVSCTAVVGAAALWGASRMTFDYNLMDLLPAEADSIVWQKRAVKDGEQSMYYGISIADDMADARAMAKRLRVLETVESLGGVGLLIPRDREAKVEKLQAVAAELGPALAEAQGPAPEGQADALLPARVQTLRVALGLGRSRLPDQALAAADALAAAADRFVAASASLDPADRDRRLGALQRDYQAMRRDTAQRIAATLDTAPLQLSDLPAEILRPYIGHDARGRQLLAIAIYPKVPESVGDPLAPGYLSRFVGQLKAADPQVTGVILQIYESGTLIWTSYLKAGVYALLAVFVLLLIDFRSLRDALLCLVPVTVGFAVTFALLVVAGVGINPANIIVLPLMFGLGVDDGVHIIHRYRQDRVNRPLGLTAGTGKGISLTSYTTIIGFGSLLIASHRGIASLGLTLALGILMTMLACWILMPAWLELRQRRAERKAA